MSWTKKQRGLGLVALLTIAVGGIAFAWAGEPSAQFNGVRVNEAPPGLTVLLETSGSPHYQASLLESPPRIVIDMAGAYAAPKMRWDSAIQPIKEIRGSQWKPGTARVVVELTREVGYRIEEGPRGLSVILSSAPNASPDPGAGRASSKAEPAKAVADVAKPAAPSSSPRAEPARLTSAVADEPKMAMKAARSKPDTTGTDVARAEVTRPRAEGPAAASPPAATPTGSALAPVPAIAADPASMRVAQTTPAAPPSQVPRPETRQAPNGSKLITLDFKDADVINVLRILGAEGGRNIVAGDDVKGKVSVSLRNVTWDQALETILEARGLQKIEKGGVIRIVSNEQLAKEREAQARAEEAKRKAEIEVRTKMAEAQLKEAELQAKRAAADAAAAEAEARGPLREEVIRLSYADPEEVAKTLQGILGIPPEGTTGAPGGPPQVIPSSGVGGPPLIAEPPFSALYGVGLQQQRPMPVMSVSQDVLAKGITIRANKATNSIFLRLYQRDLDQIKKLIREYFDVPLPQVKIEARMEILDRNALESIGVQWGGGGVTNAGRTSIIGQGFGQPNTGGGTAPFNFTPINQNLNLSSVLPVSPVTGLPAGGNLVNLPLGAFANSALAVPTAGLAFGIVGTNFNINLALQALNEMGKTRTLARPEIVTVENNKAAISLGEEIPYATVSSAGTQIQFKEALLKLEVTPTVIKVKTNGREHTKIKMVVVVENNDRGEVVNLGTSGAPPAINRRKAETLVLMNEGERLVIGGVSTARNQETIRKVPTMGDIPVLGWLFKARENLDQGRELVVFLTPSVLNAMVAAPAAGK